MKTLNQFLQLHEKRAFSLAKLSLNDREDALDAVQDAMFAMARSYAGKPEADWEKLFYTTLFNKIKDIGRKRSRLSLFSFFDHDEVKAHKGSNPDQQLFLDETLNQLALTVSTMSHKQQQIYLLKEIEGYSEKEVASMTGSSVASVKTLASRARKKVQVLGLKLDDQENTHDN